jgi:hypothetical protein
MRFFCKNKLSLICFSHLQIGTLLLVLMMVMSTFLKPSKLGMELRETGSWTNQILRFLQRKERPKASEDLMSLIMFSFATNLN